MLLASSFVSSFYLFLSLFGIGWGICRGLTYTVPMHHGWLWFPNRPGLVSGIIIGGFGFGSLIFGKVAQVLVNPDNLSADEETGRYPQEVNERVPRMLLILTMSFAAIALISILLIFPGKDHADVK